MHKEYVRLVDTADTAVLFIHGIVGTPNHFTDFVNLVPSEMSVCNMLLDGHGKGVSEFSKTSMDKWKSQVDAKVTELSKTHSKIIIVAHSMGTLFAINESVKHPDKIQKLFLLATPLKLFIKPQMMLNTMKVYFGLIKDSDKMAQAAQRAYGIKDSKNIFKYIGWIPRYLELFKEIKAVRKSVPLISTPCDVYQSAHDEMVSVKSTNILNKNNNIRVNVLAKSSHYYYDDDDYKYLLNEFSDFIQ